MKCFEFFPKVAFIAVLFFVFQASSLFSAPTSSGTKFWLAFPGSYFTKAEKKLYITGETAASGTVYIPALFFTRNFTVTPGAVTVVNLPQECDVRVSNTKVFKGVRVLSDNPVTVYAMCNDTTITDAYLGLPVSSIGTEYVVQGYKNTSVEVAGFGSQFAITGTEDNTAVTFTLSAATGSIPAGVPQNITLNEGEVYYLMNDSGAGFDLSGTYINADKKVAVFGSHMCANVPGTDLYCDYLVEQLPPVTSWGMNFIIVPLAGRAIGDTYRVIAWQDNTSVYLDGTLIANLDRGQFTEAVIAGGGNITAGKRVLVTQYANSTEYDGMTGDPFMMIIMPVEQYINNYTVYTPESGFALNYLNIVAPLSARGVLTVDGAAIPFADYTVIGTTGYAAVQYSVGTGTHNISSPSGAGVSVYGFNFRESYGYPGGAGLSDFVSTPTATVTRTLTATATHTHTITRTHTHTRTITMSQTQTPTGSVTEAVSATQTPSFSATASFTETFSATVTDTITPSVTATAAATGTFTATPADTITNTATATPSLSVTATHTPQNTYTASATQTPTFTPTASATVSVYASPSVTQTVQPQLAMSIEGVFPNPLVDGANMVFWLSKAALVTIKVFDVSGERVVISEKLQCQAGYNSWYWDRKNRAGKGAASGVFILRAEAADGDERVTAYTKAAVVK